jgi:hypothetical protein
MKNMGNKKMKTITIRFINTKVILSIQSKSAIGYYFGCNLVENSQNPISG